MLAAHRVNSAIDGRPWAAVSELDVIHGIAPARFDDMRNQGLAGVDC